MNPITAILIDDEKSGRENLSGLLREHCPQVRLMGEAISVESAIPLIEKLQPQLVFLDIEMPGANGFKLLEHFRDFSFEVIFVTAYDNYAIKAIRFSAADYILKPINLNELKDAVEKVAARIASKTENKQLKQLFYNVKHPQNPKIGLPTNDRIEFVEVKNIIRCQGESNYTHLFFANRKPLLVAKTLIEFEELLQEHGFIRVHKTHLVNLSHVTAYIRNDGGRIVLSNGDEVAVSRRRKEFVNERLKKVW
jgi:two-component system LytT family response regulator